MTETQTVTCPDYAQYLLENQTNYTLMNFSRYDKKFSHDALNSHVAVGQFYEKPNNDRTGRLPTKQNKPSIQMSIALALIINTYTNKKRFCRLWPQ